RRRRSAARSSPAPSRISFLSINLPTFRIAVGVTEQVLLSVAATQLPEADFFGSLVSMGQATSRLKTPDAALVENAAAFLRSLGLATAFVQRPEIFGNGFALAHLEAQGCTPIAHIHLGAEAAPKYFKGIPNFALFAQPAGGDSTRNALANF